MKSRLASLAIVLLTLGGARSAFGGECAPIAVEAEPELADRIRSALDTHDDIDACARVNVTKRSGGKFVVAVTLPDGRSTSRSVARADDVVPTVEALLLVPRPIEPAPEPKEETAAAPAVEETSVAPAAIDAVPAPAERPQRPAADPPMHARVELSLMSGPRLSDALPALAVGGLSFADFRGWLVGFSGRADYFPDTAGVSPSTAVTLMVLGGHRFRFGSLSWDVYGGAGLGRRGGSDDAPALVQTPRTVPTVRPPVPIAGKPGVTVPRVLLGSRLNFRSQSVFRTFMALDADAGWQTSEEEVRSQPVSDLERFPALSLGLSFGATVGTL